MLDLKILKYVSLNRRNVRIHGSKENVSVPSK